MMKMIVAVPFALLSLGVLGCSQQASTAPAVQNPATTAAPAQNDTNMFGENKEAAAGSAADARAAAYSDQAPAAAGAQSAAPK